MKKALEQGVDLRQYSRSIDKELQEIETLKQADSTESMSKLMLEAEIAKARVEGLSLIA